MSLHYYPLINKVLKTLHIKDRLAEDAFIPPSDTAFIKPFITIAREPGSGGAPIAKSLATKLGFELVDEQIVDEIAKSTKKRKAVIKSIDEKSRTNIQDLVHSLLNTEYVDDLQYISELVKVILTYAHRGKVVILGRGANFLTPFAKGLHVNVTAPYKIRVQRAMDYEGFNQKKARAVIAKVEKERKEFVRQYLLKDATKSNAYDMTINTSFFDVKKSTEIIIDAFYKKFSRKHRYLGG